MEREYLLQKQKLHILQHSERRKESMEKQNPQKNSEIIEKMVLKERGNSLSKLPTGIIIKKY
jgi:hypothetical protein